MSRLLAIRVFRGSYLCRALLDSLSAQEDCSASPHPGALEDQDTLDDGSRSHKAFLADLAQAEALKDGKQLKVVKLKGDEEVATALWNSSRGQPGAPSSKLFCAFAQCWRLELFGRRGDFEKELHLSLKEIPSRPWSRLNHSSFGKRFRALVKLLLLVRVRGGNELSLVPRDVFIEKILPHLADDYDEQDAFVVQCLLDDDGSRVTLPCENPCILNRQLKIIQVCTLQTAETASIGATMVVIYSQLDLPWYSLLTTFTLCFFLATSILQLLSLDEIILLFFTRTRPGHQAPLSD